MTEKIIPVILCGGSGTRLWPLSRPDYPKQFLRLTDEYSMLQKTALRALKISGCDASDIIVVTNQDQQPHVRRHLEELSPSFASHIISEPVARNTAAAIALAMRYCAGFLPPGTLLLVLSADAYIEDERKLKDAVEIAAKEAQSGRIVIFGMEPTRAETGFGYILTDGAASTLGAFRVAEFVEKPTVQKAEEYIEDGRYLWNSGMFAFSIETILREFEIHADFILRSISHYERLEPLPFDKVVLERSTNVSVIPCDIGWSDIGSWQSLWEVSKKDDAGNYCRGDVTITQCKDSFIYGGGKPIVCAGLTNMLIVETPDMTFVADKGNPHSIARMAKLMSDNEIKTQKELAAAK